VPVSSTAAAAAVFEPSSPWLSATRPAAGDSAANVIVACLDDFGDLFFFRFSFLFCFVFADAPVREEEEEVEEEVEEEGVGAEKEGEEEKEKESVSADATDGSVHATVSVSRWW
jgi:hypothetical protein